MAFLSASSSFSLSLHSATSTLLSPSLLSSKISFNSAYIFLLRVLKVATLD